MEDGKFMTYEQLVQSFGPVFDEIYYYGLLASIPNSWKRTLKIAEFNKPLDSDTNVELFCKVKNPCKIMYWRLIEKKWHPSKVSKQFWEKELQMALTDEQWYNLLLDLWKSVKPSKLRYFQYRIYLNALTTNSKRSRWDPSFSDKCDFCTTESESVKHLLIECNHVKKLWRNLEKWCRYFLDIQCDPKTIILNNYDGPCRELVNLMIVSLKQMIYVKKCLRELPTFPDFIE